MTEIMCRYSKDRDQAIVSYLYDDDGGFDVAERAAFEAHLVTCDRCRLELAALEEVRTSLARWSPPGLPSHDRPSLGVALPTVSPQSPAPSPRWRDVPAWAQVAAAFQVAQRELTKEDPLESAVHHCPPCNQRPVMSVLPNWRHRPGIPRIR